jgi:hypothetical protein
MPIHDWTRVDAGIFHDFHLTWIGILKNTLNAGLLPPDYYALAEQIAGSIGPDVLTLQTPNPPGNNGSTDVQGAVAVAVAPPKVHHIVRPDIDEYVYKRRSVVIRHVSNHRMVALIEILSPGNKASRHALRAFLDKAESALAHGIHLLLVDLHPPGPRDPRGIHGVLWERLFSEAVPTPEKPLTLVAYATGRVPTAYVEPVAVGDSLPDMPLFLTAEQYINVPLETTYQAAYQGVPRYYRTILETGTAS